MMMTNDDIETFEALDWQGKPIDCVQCLHQGNHAETQCQLQHACVLDRYALRIDRFFRWNPGVAKVYLKHPYFEVRAIAAKYVEVWRSYLISNSDFSFRISVLFY